LHPELGGPSCPKLNGEVYVGGTESPKEMILEGLYGTLDSVDTVIAGFDEL
jgi:hypothetical protein